MQKLHPFSGSIQQYAERDSESESYRPGSCPLCQARQELKPHGFYSRTIVDLDFESVLRIRRFLCRFCRRTVSLLPDGVLPYLRYSVGIIGRFVKARLKDGQTLKEAAVAAGQVGMPYQRGQQWLRRFQWQAESISAALAGLVSPMAAADFTTKAVDMLERAGWIRAHRFLFERLRVHLLGWPECLAPAGIAVKAGTAPSGAGALPHNTCIDSESPPA